MISLKAKRVGVTKAIQNEVFVTQSRVMSKTLPIFDKWILHSNICESTRVRETTWTEKG